jgi:hypothetical protein
MSDHATEYLLRRLHKTTADNFDLTLHGAVVDLLMSDIPLEPRSLGRQWLAELYARLAFPSKKRDKASRKRAQLKWADCAKQHLIAYGLTPDDDDKRTMMRDEDRQGLPPGEADKIVANILGVSPGAVRVRRSRQK